VHALLSGKRATLKRFVQWVLSRNKFSTRKISISQSIPVDWHSKAEENAVRIREQFFKENVDVIINADETFHLFHPFDQWLIAPTGIKHVGTVVQVVNEKRGAMVMISCESQTSSILPPMIFFTKVYCAKSMMHWANFDQANVVFNESHWMTFNTAIIYLSYFINVFKDK
jgi:hypothetical protein